MSMKTVLEVISAGAAFLEKRGVESPRLNMEHLLAHVLKLKRMQLYLQFDRPLGEDELAPLRDLMKRRAAREPLQHVLGTVEFGTHTFKSDRRALVPRPETEELVEKLLTGAKKAGSPPDRVVDVGCGSGCIGLSLAAAWPEASVLLLDVSPDARSLAAENAAALGLAAPRVRIAASDLLDAPEAAGPFDLIVANLPYIPSGEISGLSAEVRHDPALALDGGADGLQLIERLIAQAVPKLLPGGQLALEYGLGQAGAIAQRLDAAGFDSIRIEKDFTGRERLVFARKPAVF